MLSLMPFIPMSFNNTIKTGVVVVRVVTIVGPLKRTAADDATRPAVMRARRGNGVFVVIASPMGGQHPFVVAEYDAVLLIRVRPASGDQVQCIDRFARQLRQRDSANVLSIRSRGRRVVACKRGRHRTGQRAKRGST